MLWTAKSTLYKKLIVFVLLVMKHMSYYRKYQVRFFLSVVIGLTVALNNISEITESKDVFFNTDVNQTFSFHPFTIIDEVAVLVIW